MSGHAVQNYCALDFCPGYSGGKYTGSCIIPINKAPKIFKDSPFNFTPTQIAKQLEEGDNARRICTIHVKDDNQDTFELHNIQTYPIYDLIINGLLSPQPDYLQRKRKTGCGGVRSGLEAYKLTDTYTPHKAPQKYVSEVEALALEERITALIADKKLLNQQLNGTKGVVSSLKNQLLLSQDNLEAARAEIIILKEEAQNGFYTAKSVSELPTNEVKAITGIDKDGWSFFVDFTQEAGIIKFWGDMKDIPWDDALLLTPGYVPP